MMLSSALRASLLSLLVLGLVLGGLATRTAEAADAVLVRPGDDLAAMAAAAPPGQTFRIAAGLHRTGEVVPRDGQRFVGDAGAILTGAVPLDGFRRDDATGTWVADGVTAEGFVDGAVLEGHEGVRHPEDLWIDDVRLDQVLSLAELGDGSWFLDYDADRLHLATDPAGRRVELSVESFAFGGHEVEGVHLENLVVTRYATPAQGGAIGGGWNTRDTRGWTLDRITATENHAYGIIVAPGMTVTNSSVNANGQAGIGGSGTGQDGSVGYVEVTRTEIAGNRTLGFDWYHEGGGTKFSLMDGMTFAENWVHHNNGPGVWFDEYNTRAEIHSNLVEDNTDQGIFYEISSGGHIHDNVIRNNSTDARGGFYAAAIDISQSSTSLVERNTITEHTMGILVRHDGRREHEADALDNVVTQNSMALPANGITGVIVENTTNVEPLRTNVFTRNSIQLPSADSAVFAWGPFWPRTAPTNDTILTLGSAEAPQPEHTLRAYGASADGGAEAVEAPAPAVAGPQHYVRR